MTPADGRKPRVLLLTTYYHPVLGGVETHARQLATHLVRSGYDTTVLTKRVGREPDETTIDEVPVRRIGPSGERSAAGKWLALPAFVRHTMRLGRQADVIVCVDYRGIGIAAIVAGRRLGLPVIVQGETAGVLAGADEHATSGLAPESVVSRALKAPIRAIYRQADHVVCIGRDLEREAVRAGVPRERVHYIPHGVDLQRFRPAVEGERADLRASFGWRDDQLVVLFVGRLSVEKGVMDLVQAWRGVDRQDGTAVLVLVGPDMTGHAWDAGAPARAFVREHGLEGHVRFAGPTSDPSPYYRAADVFVQPSHFEALGNTAIEAMASGLPVVTSGVGGLADFCRDDVNAIVYEPRSTTGLSVAITRVLAGSSLRARLGAAARETSSQFELGLLLDRYAALIDAAVQRRQPPQ